MLKTGLLLARQANFGVNLLNVVCYVRLVRWVMTLRVDMFSRLVIDRRLLLLHTIGMAMLPAACLIEMLVLANLCIVVDSVLWLASNGLNCISIACVVGMILWMLVNMLHCMLLRGFVTLVA